MTQVLIGAATSVGVAGLLSATVSEPTAWVLALAGIAGAAYLGRRRSKPSIDLED
jgi:MYXO-CTERM domain-containing protein